MQLEVNDSTQDMKIRSMFSTELKELLVEFWRENSYAFASTRDDMSSIDPKVMVHHLNMDPSFHVAYEKDIQTRNVRSYKVGGRKAAEG